MTFFMVDKENFLLTSAEEDTIRKHWTTYHLYRCDFVCSFYRYLEENGISFVRVPSNSVGYLRYCIKDIDVCFN